jgi:hypothetical protein
MGTGVKAVKGSCNRGDGEENVKMCDCCGLEVSSWSVWLAVGKRECRGALVG